MENTERQKLTLDRPATYQIKVPVEIDRRWADWVEGMRVETTLDDRDRPVTTLTGVLDQAALQGLLRRLYSLGIPLISVNCTDETPNPGNT
jgi:hypothetical protein